VLIPGFIMAVLYHRLDMAFIVFMIAAATDALDGYLARKYEVISTIGKLLDPMADKLLVMSALIMLIPEQGGSVPAWTRHAAWSGAASLSGRKPSSSRPNSTCPARPNRPRS